MRLTEAALASGGHMSGTDAWFATVSTDSRHTAHGDLFIALAGPRFDGHDYVSEAERAGAVAALVSRPVATTLPLIEVGDTLAAFGSLARAWRFRHDARVIAVTGSNGKTTVKEMIAAILAQQGPVLSTKGNLNNDIGVPLTLFGLNETHEYAVIEMGASAIGDIARLAAIARPDIALITNAGPAHIAGFGDVEGVARGKGELYAALAPGATAVINADDAHAAYWKGLVPAGCTVRSFGERDADVHLAAAPAPTVLRGNRFVSGFTLSAPEGTVAVEMALAGRHNLRNALAAAAVTLAAGVAPEQVRAGLATLAPVPGRLYPRQATAGGVVIDDSYNANPASFDAALETLAQLHGERWLILGDMAELGAESDSWHARLGTRARECGVKRLLGCGPQSRHAVVAFGKGGAHYENREALIAALSGGVRDGAVALVKGSRSAGMEQVVAALCGGVTEGLH